MSAFDPKRTRTLLIRLSDPCSAQIPVSTWKFGSEHRQPALRLGFGRLVLQNIPVLRKHVVVHADDTAAIQFLGIPVFENRPWTIT